MNVPCWVVKAVQPQKDYRLFLTFADGQKKVYDVKKDFCKPYYRRLENPGLFMAARVDGGTVVWNDDLDFCPEKLYDEGVSVEAFPNE